MANFVRRSRWVEELHYEHFYEYTDTPGAGLSFPCTKEGKALPMNPVARLAYRKCSTQTMDPPVVDRGIIRHTSGYKVPAAIECEACGEELTLFNPMTNECKCGAFYNGSGQRLCHPSLWGEETGERFNDHGMLIF